MSRSQALAAVLLALGAAARAAEAPAPSAWDLKPSAVEDLCGEALRRAETALRSVSELPPEARSFANTPAALERALQDLEDAAAPAVLLARVSASSAAREAGGLCEARLDAFAGDIPARPDLLRALEEYSSRGEALSAEDRLLLERELAQLRSRGGALDRESRLELRYLRERVAVREKSFLDNLDWPRPSLMFAADELAGAPRSVLDALPRQGRLLRVEPLPPLYGELMASVRDPAARQRLEFLYHNRAAAANEPVLKEILSLRGRIAKLLGASSYAELALSDRLVREPGRVRAILRGLGKRLRPQAGAELAAWKKLKREELGSRGDRQIRAWDRDFYAARLRPARAAEPDSRGFPVEAALDVPAKLFGLSLSSVPKADVWRPGVSLREIRDAQSGALLGRVYLDLEPRKGKPERPWVFVLRPGREDGGLRRAPVCVLAASFPSRRGRLGDLEDFFHGLGHVLALSLSRSKHARFSGAALSPDAAEAPALLLGRLAWRPEVLDAVLGRGTDLIRLKAEAQPVSAWPWRALDDAAFALADLDLHEGASDPTAAYRRARESVALVPETPGTHPEASAPALVRDGAGASGPVLSALLAEEIWRRWEAEGVFNPAACRHLRETFFAAGAADTARGLRNYLGREPAWDAVPEPEAWPAGSGEGPQGPPWRRRVLH